jgi:hypothetical protein
MTPLVEIYAESKIRLFNLIRKMKEDGEELSVSHIQSRMREKSIYISPNEPEITSYVIIFSE